MCHLPGPAAAVLIDTTPHDGMIGGVDSVAAPSRHRSATMPNAVFNVNPFFHFLYSFRQNRLNMGGRRDPGANFSYRHAWINVDERQPIPAAAPGKNTATRTPPSLLWLRFGRALRTSLLRPHTLGDVDLDEETGQGIRVVLLGELPSTFVFEAAVVAAERCKVLYPDRFAVEAGDGGIKVSLWSSIRTPGNTQSL